jgi:hypothetical protein
MLQLRLNPELDTERKCVQIPDFLEEASAARLEAVIPTLPWLILQDDSKQNLYLKREESFLAKPPAEQSRLMAGMQRRAAEGEMRLIAFLTIRFTD